jgi:hypothetical protein
VKQCAEQRRTQHCTACETGGARSGERRAVGSKTAGEHNIAQRVKQKQKNEHQEDKSSGAMSQCGCSNTHSFLRSKTRSVCGVTPGPILVKSMTRSRSALTSLSSDLTSSSGDTLPPFCATCAGARPRLQRKKYLLNRVQNRTKKVNKCQQTPSRKSQKKKKSKKEKKEKSQKKEEKKKRKKEFLSDSRKSGVLLLTIACGKHIDIFFFFSRAEINPQYKNWRCSKR